MSSRLPAGRIVAAGAAGAALLAAGSLLIVGETTSVDANNWLIWATQAAKGEAVDPAWAQTSFKPLPVLVAVPFALVDQAAANVAWLWLVRFALLLCPTLLFLLAARRFGVVAGAVAAILPFALPTWVGYGIDGDSEPLVAALLLGAAVCSSVARPKLVTACLATASLLRPEAAGLLVAWLAWLWHSQGRGAAVRHFAPSAAVVAIGWILFPWMLGTSFGEASATAHTRLFVPNSREGILSILPLSAWLLTAVGAFGLRRGRDPLLSCLLAGAALWIAEVAALTWLGFPGVDRYLYPAAIALCAVAGAGAAVLAEAAPAGAARTALGTVLIAGAFALAAIEMPLARDNIERRSAKAESAERAVAAFNRSGGLGRWGSCRPFAANIGWSVIIARMLGEPLGSFTPAARPPTVAFAELPLSEHPNDPAVEGDAVPRLVGFASPDWAILRYPADPDCVR